MSDDIKKKIKNLKTINQIRESIVERKGLREEYLKKMEELQKLLKKPLKNRNKKDEKQIIELEKDIKELQDKIKKIIRLV